MAGKAAWSFLNEMADFISGGTPSKSNASFWMGDIPWVSAKDMKVPRLIDVEDHITPAALREGSCLAPAGATLVLTRGMTLLSDVPICAIIRDMAFNQDVKAVVPRDGVDPSFLNYALRAAKPELLGMVELAGHGTGRLPTDRLKALRLRCPPLPEQKAIARILGALDDKIELNRRMNETLEAMARAIFKSWFVDFDPVKAKAAGCRPAGMDAATAALFPGSFENSELGEIPKGWKVLKASSILEILGGGTPRTSAAEYWGGDIPWFSVVDAPRECDVWVIDTQRKITRSGLENSAAEVLAAGTTIVSARGTVGKLALVGTPMAMNQSCYAIIGRPPTGPYLTYYSLKNVISILKQRTHGSVFDTITRDTFDTVDIILPSANVASAFDQRLKSILAQMLNNLRESGALAAIRNALLPELLSGEIQIHCSASEVLT